MAKELCQLENAYENTGRSSGQPGCCESRSPKAVPGRSSSRIRFMSNRSADLFLADIGESIARIAGLRNRIVHDYFGLDLEIIWHIVRSDLPALKRDLPPGAMGTHCAGRSFRRGQFHLRRTGGRSHSGQPRRHAVSLLSSTLPNWPSGSGRFFSMP